MMKRLKNKIKHLLKKTVGHLKEDIKGYKEKIKKGLGGKKEQKHEIKEDHELIKDIKEIKHKKTPTAKPKSKNKVKKKKKHSFGIE